MPATPEQISIGGIDRSLNIEYRRPRESAAKAGMTRMRAAVFLLSTVFAKLSEMPGRSGVREY
jgi:hypothetical protein